jgi:hypothetical protein
MKIRTICSALLASVFIYISTHAFAQQPQSITDVLVLGHLASEKLHNAVGINSSVVAGGLNEPARVLLPPPATSWEGGRISFTLNVDPEKTNYFTAKFWGSEANPNSLVLFCEGKQIGYHHLGDYDVLYLGDTAPAYNGRFFYTTSPLPIEMTRGKKMLTFEIRSRGPAWRYGQSFEQYQKNMEKPTCGIYRVYTHINGYFIPPANEKQGTVPDQFPVRKQPGKEVLTKLKTRVNESIDALINLSRPLEQQEMFFLAKAWRVQWTAAYQNKIVIPIVTRSIDEFFRKQRKNPALVTNDPQQYNPDWFGFGTIGNVVLLLNDQLSPAWEQQIDDGAGNKIPRKTAWAELLLSSREYLRTHRRQYTNQSMIIDMNLYLSNKALAVLDPSKAFSEQEALRYLYEAVGLQPWLGCDTDNGPEKPLGDQYYQLTDKGLTKELGYVGYYGEVLDWVTQLYGATCKPGDLSSGDPKIREQLIKMAKARAVFRYPAMDEEGNRAMRVETVIGWRDTHYPGDVTYAERQGWDASPFLSVVATMDAHSIGYAQQMLDDNQFFKTVEDKMATSGNLRVTQSLLPVPDQYEILKATSPAKYRLPMSNDQPDFVWSDEEDGVVALKNGDDILYVSLYWRARHAINNLARVHFITPSFDRVGVVFEKSEFEPSGLEYTRGDWIDFGFGKGGHQYPGELHSAHTGEKLPIARIPAGIAYKPGEENSYAGKADFYILEYGNYLIGMNTSKDQAFDLLVPDTFKGSVDLTNKKTMIKTSSLKVLPRKTILLYKTK